MSTEDVTRAYEALSIEALQQEREALRNAPSRPDLSAISAAITAKGATPIDGAVVERDIGNGHVTPLTREQEWSAHGLAEKPTPADYRPSLNRYGATPELVSQLRDFNASLSLDAQTGNSVAERLADVVQQLDVGGRDSWDDWAASADKVTLRIVGSREAYDALVTQAKAALTRSGTTLASKLADHVALRDPVLLRLLANSQAAYERLTARYKSG